MLFYNYNILKVKRVEVSEEYVPATNALNSLKKKDVKKGTALGKDI